MLPQMSFVQGIVYTLGELAPAFVVVSVFFIILSWVRVVVDKMGGSGL